MKLRAAEAVFGSKCAQIGDRMAVSCAAPTKMQYADATRSYVASAATCELGRVAVSLTGGETFSDTDLAVCRRL